MKRRLICTGTAQIREITLKNSIKCLVPITATPQPTQQPTAQLNPLNPGAKTSARTDRKVPPFRGGGAGLVAPKYPGVCRRPAGWRRVAAPTTGAPAGRQHRAAGSPRASAWTERWNPPEESSAAAARRFFPSRPRRTNSPLRVSAAPLPPPHVCLRRGLTTASCLPPPLAETDQ